MTRDDIIRMAREAGLPYIYQTGEVANLGLVERFAALVAAAERQACAKVLDWNREMCQPNGTLDMVLHACAAAIRARGQS